MIKSRFKIRKSQKHKAVKRKPRYWILSVTAVGLLVAFTVGESRALNIAHVRDNRIVAAKSVEKENPAIRRFSIPPGTLSEVLTTFEKVTGWQFVVPVEIKNIASNGVTGDYADEQALKQILQNTGVTYSFTSPKEVSLKLQGPAETVEVAGENSALSSPKYTEPLRDIPQTITVIDKKTIEEQGSTTLRDVLRNIPGLTVAAGEGGTPAGDNLTLRGFSARNDIYIDGARDLGPQTRDPFNLEQVEVVKGPSSALTGRGSTGGTINLISKIPGFKPFYDFSATFGSDQTKRITGDINLPLERLGWGDRTTFRVNLMAHDSNFAGREIIKNNRWGIAPTLTFGIGKQSSLTLSYFHLSQNNISDYGIPWVPNTNNLLVAYRDRPAPVPRDTFYGFIDRDTEMLKADLGTIVFNHVFNDKLNLRNQFRYGFSTRDSIATPPRLANNSSTSITREMRAWWTQDETFDNQTDFTARFLTGKFEHSLVTGVELVCESNIRKLRSAPNAATTLLNPNPFDVYTGTIIFTPFIGDVTATTQSAYLFDTIKLHPKFELSGGLRFDRFDAGGVSATATTLTPVARVDNLLSYRLGAVYKPIPIGSIYVSYGTSLNPSLEGLSYSAASAAVDPEKTYTLEAGTKWDLFSNRLLLAGAVFRVNKTNARTPGLPGEEPIVLSGKQRVDGIELSATGNFTKNWSVLAGYTLLDSEIVSSNIAPTIVNGVSISEVGKRLINTPKSSFNLWTTYQFPFRLSLGGGARFVDRRYGNTINTRFVDSYWLIDATASYQINKHLDLRLNINNLTDKFYFDRITGGQVVPGAARTLLFMTNFHF
ncbi:MAG: TonB-dependent siderophore receptor [Actinomycetota bacterium]